MSSLSLRTREALLHIPPRLRQHDGTQNIRPSGELSRIIFNLKIHFTHCCGAATHGLCGLIPLQVNKQGVSDRVVDEMNPGQQFTRAQVGILTAYEDKEMPLLSDEDLQSVSELTNGDPVLKATLERNREWITTVRPLPYVQIFYESPQM